VRLLNGHSSAAHSIIERAGPVNDAAWGVEKNLLEISPDRLFEGGFAQKVSHPRNLPTLSSAKRTVEISPALQHWVTVALTSLVREADG